MRINCQRSNGLHSFTAAVVVLVFMVGFAGCAHTAVITDRSDTKTMLTGVTLEEYPRFKVLLGGSIREIPVNDVRMMKIDASESIIYERDYYYSLQMILKDGSVLSQSGKSTQAAAQCYICVRNTLKGKHHREVFRIPLENIQQLKNED